MDFWGKANIFFFPSTAGGLERKKQKNGEIHFGVGKIHFLGKSQIGFPSQPTGGLGRPAKILGRHQTEATLQAHGPQGVAQSAASQDLPRFR